MEIPLVYQMNQEQMFMQEQADDQLGQPPVAAPLPQVPVERGNTIGLFNKIKWDDLIFILLLTCLFGCSLYYGITGVKDRYTNLVIGYTCIVYLFLTNAFGSIVIEAIVGEPRVRREFSEYLRMTVISLVSLCIYLYTYMIWE